MNNQRPVGNNAAEDLLEIFGITRDPGYYRQSLAYNMTEDVAVILEDQGITHDYAELEKTIQRSLVKYLGGKTSSELSKYDFKNWGGEK